jgi:hypothetical protein
MITLQHAIFGRPRSFLLLSNQIYHQENAIYLEETSGGMFSFRDWMPQKSTE